MAPHLQHGLFRGRAAVVEHWNGTYWAIVNVPDPQPALPTGPSPGGTRPPRATSEASRFLVSPPARGRRVAGRWLRDRHGVQTYAPSPWETLTEHWNGTSWSRSGPDATLPEPLSGGSSAADDLLTSASESSGGTSGRRGAMPGSALTLQLGSPSGRPASPDGIWCEPGGDGRQLPSRVRGERIRRGQLRPGISPLAGW